MAIVPDEKDWTWVLERPCPECGFDAATADPDRIGPLIRDDAARWQEFLRRPDVRDRPDESTWSPLEYGCHVRDVFRTMEYRVARMCNEDNPTYANWDQDATATEDRYDLQDPAVVAVELADAAEHLAATFDELGPEEWARPGTRSNGSRFTIESLARYLVHDVVHHEWDLSR